MRCLLTTSLALATLAGVVTAHSPSHTTTHDLPKLRKSLAFGPAHPHAVFYASPYQIKTNSFVPQIHGADPFDVARLFIEDVIPQGAEYKIRKDSYTDNRTGVTHVYVKQVVNGLEVADGDMNMNIKDGMVLSYGSSFFNGPIPTGVSALSADELVYPREAYCDSLREAKASLLPSSFSQTPLTNTPRPSQEDLHTLDHLMRSNCDFVLTPAFSALAAASPEELLEDFRPALLQFMATALPSPELQADIQNNFAAIMDKMSVHMSHNLQEGNPEFIVANVPGAVSDVKARPAYQQIQRKDGGMELVLVWRFEVEMVDNWYETTTLTVPPFSIISVVDWASDSPFTAPVPPSEPTVGAYNVFAWGVNDPSVENRTIEKENFDALASPAGWHALPVKNDPSFKGRSKPGSAWSNTTTTWGNNVFAQENWEGQNAYIDNYRPEGGDKKVFDYTYDPKVTDKGNEAQEEAQKYINATVAQLFYTSNLVHDLYYRYGFDEVSGNFQQHNFGRGGAENDAVIANAQDGSGYNNANFMTPPDGQNGRMRMYLWNTAIPYRDGDLEAGIVIHELSHGLSTRLTGGPANSGCLGWGESGGMGEGWGDFLATTIRSRKEYSDYAMGAWAANRENGIRNYVYSLNETVNPSTYKTLDKPGYWGVHAIGEVWAEILWVVSQGLIEKHGYAEDLFPPAPFANGTVPAGDFYRTSQEAGKPLIPKHGNSLIVQLVLDGMKLQACRPSFFDARDAIIQADQILTGGENFCLLWKGFSKRGLGPDARVEGRTPWGGGVRFNGYTVPAACADE